MGEKREIFILLLLVLSLSTIHAASIDRVITNSESWTDVYSGIHYATLIGAESNFLTSTAYGTTLLNGIDEEEAITVVSSKKDPYVFNYPYIISNEGFESVNEVEGDNLNIELIEQEELDNIDNFIIVSDDYGYDSIAIAPYAVQSNSWVFFANELNIDDIDEVLSKKNIDNILIYGYVDREVRDTLEKYSPEVINTGNRFEDNIEIVEKFLEIKETSQIYLSDGNYIETELMQGANPILFTGEENVPEVISDYIKDSDIKIGVLVGNELIGAATNIRESTGISVMVKYARSSRTASSDISSVEGLDLFPLPEPILSLELYSLEYNILSQQLEVTYKSSSNVQAYFLGTVTVNTETENIKIGDESSVYIAPNSYKTVTYPISIDSYEDLSAQVYTIYGESSSALDRVISIEADIDTVEVIDNCELKLTSLSYNKQEKEFKVKVKNIGDVDCWAEATVDNVIMGYEEESLTSEETQLIESGKNAYILIGAELNSEDIESNDFISTTVYFGQRKTSLIQMINEEMELKVHLMTPITITIIVLLTITILLTMVFVKKRKENADFL